MKTKIALALLAAGLLAGCTPDAAPASAPAPAAAPEPAPAPTPLSPDEQYIAMLQMGQIAYSTDDAAIDTGHAICAAFDAGNTLLAVGSVLSSNGGYSGEDSGYIIGSAVGAYCPEHESVFA